MLENQLKPEVVDTPASLSSIKICFYRHLIDFHFGQMIIKMGGGLIGLLKIPFHNVYSTKNGGRANRPFKNDFSNVCKSTRTMVLDMCICLEVFTYQSNAGILNLNFGN